MAIKKILTEKKYYKKKITNKMTITKYKITKIYKPNL